MQSPLPGTVPPVSRQRRSPAEVHVLSSTATSAAMELKRALGSTGHKKRKSVEANALAEGVTESAEKMVKVLGEINLTQKTTEREKVKVHSRHFEQQLQYKKDRDKMTFENFRIAQEHTRMSLMNQSMVVQAIASLASAISRSVGPGAGTSGPPGSTEPDSVPAPTVDAQFVPNPAAGEAAFAPGEEHANISD